MARTTGRKRFWFQQSRELKSATKTPLNKQDISFDDFSDQLSSLKTDQPVYVYCAAGRRGGKAMRIMAELGFTEVYNLAGGIGAWMDEKMSVDKP